MAKNRRKKECWILWCSVDLLQTEAEKQLCQLFGQDVDIFFNIIDMEQPQYWRRVLENSHVVDMVAVSENTPLSIIQQLQKQKKPVLLQVTDQDGGHRYWTRVKKIVVETDTI